MSLEIMVNEGNTDYMKYANRGLTGLKIWEILVI